MAKSVKIDFSDIRKFEKATREAIKDNVDYEAKGLLQATTLVHREAVNNTKAGVKYIKGIHKTGNLRKSLTFEIGNGEGTIFTDGRIVYPKFVEFGTVKMRERPFLTIALAENRKKIDEIFDKIIKKQVKKMQV